jgi:hypothetical protein
VVASRAGRFKTGRFRATFVVALRANGIQNVVDSLEHPVGRLTQVSQGRQAGDHNQDQHQSVLDRDSAILGSKETLGVGGEVRHDWLRLFLVPLVLDGEF